MPDASTLLHLPLAQMNATNSPAVVTPAPAPVTPAVPSQVAPAPAPGPEAQPHLIAPAPPAPANSATPPTTGQQVAGTQHNDAVKPDNSFPYLMPILILGFIGFYFFLMRGQKKTEKARKALLAEMKKGDKVQTIGGLVARIVSIDNDEVVLKIDESSNTKAVYKKSAIASVIVPQDDKTK